jgi:hypothetical protein
MKIDSVKYDCPICKRQFYKGEMFKHFYLNHTEEEKIETIKNNPDAMFSVAMSGAALVYDKLNSGYPQDDTTVPIEINALYYSLLIFLVDAYKAGEKNYKQNRIDFSDYMKTLTRKGNMLKVRVEAALRDYR